MCRIKSEMLLFRGGSVRRNIKTSNEGWEKSQESEEDYHCDTLDFDDNFFWPSLTNHRSSCTENIVSKSSSNESFATTTDELFIQLITYL
jgi:hypothetical protein